MKNKWNILKPTIIILLFILSSIPTINAESVEWDITLDFRETGGKIDYVVFGEAPDANDGPPYDIYDLMKPPAPMQPYLRAWFDDNLPMPYSVLWEDYRGYPDTNKTWDLYVKWKSYSDNLTNITISWDVDGFTDCEYNSVVLWRYDPFDQEWDFAADMLIATNYIYELQWFNEQWLMDHFQIVATTDGTESGNALIIIVVVAAISLIVFVYFIHCTKNKKKE